MKTHFLNICVQTENQLGVRIITIGSNILMSTEWPKKVRTSSVLFIQNHVLLKSALKEV